MRKIGPDHYHEFISWADQNSCNRVYPLSIAEGFQSGVIFINDREDAEAVLFRHFCGFAYISGSPSERFLRQLWKGDGLADGRRMVLITDDDRVTAYFKSKGAVIGRRAEYAYTPGCDAGRRSGRPEQTAEIVELDDQNIKLVSGRITPRFSWESEERFLKHGFGYMALERGKFCGVSFSAAVSSGEIDIGVEVAEEYRGRGLAVLLAEKMCSRILEKGKKPVWAHGLQNTGSMRTALRAGFAEKKINSYIRLELG